MIKVICKIISTEDLKIDFLEVVDSPLDLNFVKNNIGRSDNNAVMDICYSTVPQLSDLVVVRDLVGKEKDLPLSLELPTGLKCYGDCVICIVAGTCFEDLNLYGLSLEQANAIKSMLVKSPSFMTQVNWFNAIDFN